MLSAFYWLTRHHGAAYGNEIASPGWRFPTKYKVTTQIAFLQVIVIWDDDITSRAQDNRGCFTFRAIRRTLRLLR
jgi:hypothetical protein